MRKNNQAIQSETSELPTDSKTHCFIMNPMIIGCGKFFFV